MARSAWVAVIWTSRGAGALGAAPARRAARARRRRGSARSGTTGARGARSRCAGAARARSASLTAISECSAHQPAHVVAEDREHLEVVDRLDGGRAPLVVEHRQLAEDVARPERGERDLAPVGVLADRARVAGCGRRSTCSRRRPRGTRPRRRRSGAARRPRRPASSSAGPSCSNAGTRASRAATSSARAGIAAGIPHPPPRRARGRPPARAGASDRVERVLAAAAPAEPRSASRDEHRDERERERDRERDQRDAGDHLEHPPGVVQASAGVHAPSSSSPPGAAALRSATSSTATVENAARLFTRRTLARGPARSRPRRAAAGRGSTPSPATVSASASCSSRLSRSAWRRSGGCGPRPPAR